MDLLSLLIQARVCDIDGALIGEVLEINITAGKLEIMIDAEADDDEDEEDPDDGSKEEIPEDDASKAATPKLRAVAGGKGNG